MTLRHPAVARIGIAAIPVAAVLIILGPYLWPPDHAPGSYFSDLHHQHGPNLAYLADAVRRDGELPRWNPQDFAGVPTIGDPQAGVYNPVYWALLLRPTLHSMGLMIVGYTLAGAVGFLLYARTLGCSLAASATGAVAFTLGGKLLLHLVLPGHTVKAPFFLVPLILWTVERVARRPTRGAVAAVVAPTAVLVLTLHPQILLYSAVVLVVVGAATAWRAPRRGGVFFALAAAVVLILGITAVHWMPFFGFLGEFSRAHPELYDVARWNAAHAETQARWREIVTGTSDTWEAHYFFGGVTLWLALVGLLGEPPGTRQRTTALLHGALAGVFLLYGLGSSGGLQPLLDRLPGFGALRLPARALVVVGFPVAVLVTLGVDALAIPSRRRNLVGGGTLALVTAILWSTDPARTHFALLGTAALGGAVIAIAPTRRTVGGCMLALALAFDAGRAVAPWVYTAPEAPSAALAPGVTLPAGVAAAVRLAEVGRDTASPGIPELAKRRHRLETLAGYNSLIPWRFIVYVAFASGYDPVEHNIGDTVPVRPARQRLFDLLGVNDFLYAPDQEDAAWRWTRTGTALPRAYFVPGPIVHPEGSGRDAVASETAALERLVDMDPTRQVLLHGGDAATALAASGALPGEILEEFRPVPIARRGAHRIELDVDAAHPGILVLNEPYFPGWRAFDGATEIPVLRANVLFRALALPAGAHRIRLEFSPWPWRVGWWVSVVTLLALGVGLLIPVRAGHAASEPSPSVRRPPR